MAVPVSGYTELDLIGFTDKGTYNAATTYVANDLVSYNGIKWKCLQDGTVGVTPTEGVSWSVFIIDNEINDNAVSATSTWSSQKINTTKADQTAIAPVENGTTASRAYAIDENFMKDGAFCTAIAAIAQGATFTLDTNYMAGTVGERVAEIEENLSVKDIHTDFELNNAYLTSGAITALQIQNIVLFSVNATGASGSLPVRDDMSLIKYNGEKTINAGGIMTMFTTINKDGGIPHVEAASWSGTTKYIRVSNRTEAGRYLMMQGFFIIS